MSTYLTLGQRDGRWASKQLGYGTETLGKSGCLFFSLLMLVCRDQEWKDEYVASFMGCLKDPKHGNYTQSGGSMLQSFNVAACRPTTWGPCVCVNPGASVYNGVDMPTAELTALIAHLKAGNPAIIEVDDRGPSAGANHSAHQHFVLAVSATDDGQIVIHDPWYGDETTLAPRYGKTNYWAIYRAIKYNLSTNPTPTPTYPTPKFTASATSITAGQSVTLSWSSTDGANEIRLNGAAQSGPSGSTVVAPTANTTYSLFVGYPDAPSVTLKVAILVTPAPVPVAAPAFLGVNTVDPVNGYEDALKAGTPFISVTFNAGLPEVIHQYYPNVLIGNRGNWNRGQQPSVAFFDDRNGGVYNIPDAYIMGLNENDHGLGVSAGDIRKRFEWDQRILQHIKDIGGQKGHKLNYCGAGFSAGEPNIQDKAVVEALALYGELLKDECFCFNYHTYTTDDHGVGCTAEFQRDLIWNEDFSTGTSERFINGKWEAFTEKFYRLEWTATRWHAFYRRCGWPRYDRAGNLTRIVSDETGVDIGSKGGIPWFNMSDEWTQRWARRWVFAQGAPFDIGNGVMEPSHLVWGAMFQVGAGTWQTYNMQRYCKALGECKWGRG